MSLVLRARSAIRISRLPRYAGVGVLALLLGSIPASARAGEVRPEDGEDAAPESAHKVLEDAFTNMYGCNTRSEIELIMRSRTGSERRRLLRAARKDIDGELHSIGRLVEPSALRGMTVLTIDTGDHGHEAFVYLPSQNRVRRISMAQRADSFMGSDVTYEDLARLHADAYRLEFLLSEELDGEQVRVILAFPNESRNYERAQFLVAARDGALLGIRYFKRGSETPFRILSAERDSMHSEGGHVLPTEITVRNLARGTSTRVNFRDLEVNPAIEDRVFSSALIDRGTEALDPSSD